MFTCTTDLAASASTGPCSRIASCFTANIAGATLAAAETIAASERCARSVSVRQILSDLGIHKIRLLTNTQTHVPALQGFGIEIVEQVPVRIGSAAAR